MTPPEAPLLDPSWAETPPPIFPGAAPEPTRAAGLAHLERFAPRAGRAYQERRNYDLGPGAHRAVSQLSPWVRHRLILEEEALAATLARHSPDAAEKFVQEVLWRAYFKGWLEHRPSVWTDYAAGLRQDLNRLERDGGVRARYEAAVNGATGIDGFDSWARELAETGYLHNHARMWAASIWIFTLQLPWRLGADWFYRRLLDGDPASNTLSWRWVAGLHTRGKTYQARASNIAKYTEERHRPEHQLSPAAIPLDEPDNPPPEPLPPGDAIPAAPAALLITEEDCQGEALLDGQSPPVAVGGLTVTTARSPLEVGAPALAFAQGAVADGLARAAAAFAVPATDFGEAPAARRRRRLGEGRRRGGDCHGLCAGWANSVLSRRAGPGGGGVRAFPASPPTPLRRRRLAARHEGIFRLETKNPQDIDQKSPRY